MSLSTHFTVWHYLIVLIALALFIFLTVFSLRQNNTKMALSMIFSSFLVITLVSVFMLSALDKYTKKVQLSKLDNRRLLMSEKIAYTGIVTNVGNYTIGKVTIEFKLVNKGHVTGNVKGGSYFKPSGFFDFFSGANKRDYKVQTVVKDIVVAKNLKPGKSKYFNVSFNYPPHFKQVAHFQRIFAH